MGYLWGPLRDGGQPGRLSPAFRPALAGSPAGSRRARASAAQFSASRRRVFPEAPSARARCVLWFASAFADELLRKNRSKRGLDELIKASIESYKVSRELNTSIEMTSVLNY